MTLTCASFATLGNLTTISGGTLLAPNGISLGSGCAISGSGAVTAAIAAGYGATINATGNLTLGDSTSYDGFVSDGRLYTHGYTVTLNSKNAANNSNAAVLGSLTQIDGGGLVAPNGILLGNGNNSGQYGQRRHCRRRQLCAVLNLGNVQGPSSASSDWLTFNIPFNGVSGQTSGRIAFASGYSTGSSPAVETQFGCAELGGAATEFAIGGSSAGNNGSSYGQLNVVTNPSDINDQGNLTILPGTWIKIVDSSGFLPTPGESFTVLTWTGTRSGTASLSVDPAFLGPRHSAYSAVEFQTA